MCRRRAGCRAPRNGAEAVRGPRVGNRAAGLEPADRTARSTVLGVVGARGLEAHSDQLLLSAALDEERFVVGIGLPSNRA